MKSRVDDFLRCWEGNKRSVREDLGEITIPEKTATSLAF
jgi:hypothetical protein